MIFVKEGELGIWEEDRLFTLEAGQALHLWPQLQHGGSKPMSLELKFYWIHFEVVRRNDGRDAASSAIQVPQVARVERPEKLESLFRYFLDEQESGCLAPSTANLLVTLMLIEVARSADSRRDADCVNVAATRAHTYIRLHYDLPISPSRIAEALGYNPDYLGRVYRTVYGHTLTEAIHHRRVGVARRLLLDSDLPIQQIAQTCGFSDPDYFRRVFRRYVQTSPRAYRRQAARVHVNTE
ncbi:MAG: AraC family transcriptional regulator [Anaerolineae bacterium]|nr:AraC family transcriptional regulator [Anaerolineae bacterium]